MTFSSPIKTTTTMGLCAILLTACSAYEEPAEYVLPADAQANYEIFNDKLDGVKNLVSDAAYVENTANVNARNDTVEMSGIFGFAIDDLLSDDIVTGEISTSADFGNDTITGEFTNVYVALGDANGAHVEGTVRPLEGTVTHTGTIEDDGIESLATGQWTDPDGTIYTAYLQMDGTLYLVSIDGTDTLVATGDFSGNMTVADATTGEIYDVQDHYDLDGDVDGEVDYGFYLCEGGCPIAD